MSRKLDYEWDFLMILHARLKEIIVGKVYTDIEDDQLYVEFTYEQQVWHYRLDDFGSRFYNGLTVEHVVNEVTRLYRRFILRKYFYTERESSI